LDPVTSQTLFVFVPGVKRMNRRKTESCRSIFDQEVSEIACLVSVPFIVYRKRRVFMRKWKWNISWKRNLILLYLILSIEDKGKFKNCKKCIGLYLNQPSDGWPKPGNSVIITHPHVTCHSKPVWISFFCRIQKYLLFYCKRKLHSNKKSLVITIQWAVKCCSSVLTLHTVWDMMQPV